MSSLSTWILRNSRCGARISSRSSIKRYIATITTTKQKQQRPTVKTGVEGGAVVTSSTVSSYTSSYGEDRLIIHWFRNTDLRLHDNDALTHSSRWALGDETDRRCPIIPIYIFDTHQIFGTKNTLKVSSSSSSSSTTKSTSKSTTTTSLMKKATSDAVVLSSESESEPSSSSSSSSSQPLEEGMLYTTSADSSKDSHRVLKCGPRRAQFIIDSALDLRHRIQTRYPKSAQLLIGVGNPADVLETLLLSLIDYETTLQQQQQPHQQQHQQQQQTNNNNKKKENHHTDADASVGSTNTDRDTDDCSSSSIQSQRRFQHFNVAIVCQDEPAFEEREQVRAVSAMLTKYHKDDTVTKRVQRIWGSTLYTPHKMPFDPSFRNVGNKMRGFINRMVQLHTIQAVLPMPKYFAFPKQFHSEMSTYIPTLRDLGYTNEQIAMVDPTKIDVRSQIRTMQGGETAGLQRIQQYIWDDDLLKDWSTMRHGPIAQNQSSRFSMYLAHGCISPRYIAEIIRKYQYDRFANNAFVMVQQDFVKRDFCKYYAAKHTTRLFRKRIGPVLQTKGEERYIKPSTCPIIFAAWKNGKTGYPLIDACMRELLLTGYITDRCRMLAASFLCNDLHYEWTYGANYFESVAIDYNVFCNWVNWAIVGGKSHGHTFDKLFYNHEYKQYDPKGEYIRTWVEELRPLPNQFVTEPWKMTSNDESSYNFVYGVDYPYRMVLPRVKAIAHRNEDDTVLIREMIKRNISIKGIKGLKTFLNNNNNNDEQND